MTPPPPIEHRYDTCDSRWLAAGRDQARIRPFDSQPVSSSNFSCIAHADRHPVAYRALKHYARPRA
jgi:hypothetical protein